MSFKAHECFCYSPHYSAVGEFLHDVGSNPKMAALNPVSDARQLRGYNHILFFNAKNHNLELPIAFRDVLRERGALVIEIDDTLERLFVRHENEPLNG
jgi:hypothetical protein